MSTLQDSGWNNKKLFNFLNFLIPIIFGLLKIWVEIEREKHFGKVKWLDEREMYFSIFLNQKGM